MHYYSEFHPKSEIKKPFWRTHATYSTCAPHARCKNHQTCKTCRAIWAKKQVTKLTESLTHRDLNRFKFQYYITINPTWFNTDPVESSRNLDAHIRSLVKSKRSKSSLLFGSEYVFIKEISHSETLGYHAHYNLIVYTDTAIHNQEIKGYRYHVTPISRDHIKHYKRNHKSPLIQNLKNILFYSLKYDPQRAQLEQNSNLSKGVHDLLHSDLFKTKPPKLAKSFPIHIEMINPSRREAREAIKHAKEVHRCYKLIHSKAKDITIHRHALKTRRAIERINTKLARTIKLLTRKGAPKTSDTVHTKLIII